MSASPTPQDALKWWYAVTAARVRDDQPDLTQRQTAILLHVYLQPQPHTVRGLAEALSITKPAVTRALDTLSRFDLLKRRKDPEDLRNVLVQRTVKGSVFLREFADLIVESSDLSGEEAGKSEAA